MICHLNSPFFKSIISLGEGCAHNLTAIQVRYWEQAECHTKCNTYIYFASSMLIRVCLGRKGRNYISFYTIWTKIGEKSKISQKFHQKWVRPSLSISQYPINWAMICHLNSPFFKSIISLGEGCVEAVWCWLRRLIQL